MLKQQEVCKFCKSPLRYFEIETLGTSSKKKIYMPCTCNEARQRRAENLKKTEELEKRAQSRKRTTRIRNSGIPYRYTSAENPMSNDCYNLIKEDRGIYITGNVGTGKTHLAASIALLGIDDDKNIKFTTTPNILSELKDTFTSDISEETVIAKYANCDLLIIDDLGKESPTDWTLMQLFRLINERYERIKPVIVTSQFERPELIKRLCKNGDEETAIAIVSRLYEMCETLHLKGKDKRLKRG